jgi:hypothetical protein
LPWLERMQRMVVYGNTYCTRMGNSSSAVISSCLRNHCLLWPILDCLQHQKRGTYSATRLLLAARVLASFGLLLTAVWFYVGRRHLKYCKYIRGRAQDRLPEYRATREGGLEDTFRLWT